MTITKEQYESERATKKKFYIKLHTDNLITEDVPDISIMQYYDLYSLRTK